MTTETLLTHEDDGILVMRINRVAKKNALNLEALRSLAAAYTHLSESPRLRAGVLAAEGETFCAGLDLMEVIPAAVEQGAAAYLAPGQCDPFRLFGPACVKPVITAVQGRCFTAGLELTLAADLCVAAADAVFGQQEATRGIFPLGGGTFRLPAAIGRGRAMRMILAGGTFTAAEAHAWGLVQEVAPPGEQLARALDLARRVAACAPLAVQAALANTRLAEMAGVAAAIADIRTAGTRVALTGDAREGMLSMIERRPARFRGE